MFKHQLWVMPKRKVKGRPTAYAVVVYTIYLLIQAILPEQFPYFKKHKKAHSNQCERCDITVV